MEQIIIFTVLIIALGAASYMDLKVARIPNLVTFPLVAAGLITHSMMNGLDGLAFSAKGFGIGFGLLILLYAVGGFGAGDVKLVAATGSLLGPSAIVSAIFMAALVGGFCALGLLVFRLGLRGTAQWVLSFLKMLLLLGGKLPALPSGERRLALRYAPVFTVGTLISLTLYTNS